MILDLNDWFHIFCKPQELTAMIASIRQKFAVLQILHHAKVYQAESHVTWTILNEHYELILKDVGLIPYGIITELLEIILWRPSLQQGFGGIRTHIARVENSCTE